MAFPDKCWRRGRCYVSLVRKSAISEVSGEVGWHDCDIVEASFREMGLVHFDSCTNERCFRSNLYHLKVLVSGWRRRKKGNPELGVSRSGKWRKEPAERNICYYIIYLLLISAFLMFLLHSAIISTMRACLHCYYHPYPNHFLKLGTCGGDCTGSGMEIDEDHGLCGTTKRRHSLSNRWAQNLDISVLTRRWTISH